MPNSTLSFVTYFSIPIHTDISSAAMDVAGKGISKLSKRGEKSLKELAAANEKFSLNLEDMLPLEFSQHFLEPLSTNQFCTSLNLDGVQQSVTVA